MENVLLHRKSWTKIFPVNEIIDSLNSIYSKNFSFLSFKIEKFQKSCFDWETLNSPPPYLDLFVRFLKLFKSTVTLTFASSTNSKSFILFPEIQCKFWYVFERITHFSSLLKDRSFCFSADTPSLLNQVLLNSTFVVEIVQQYRCRHVFRYMKLRRNISILIILSIKTFKIERYRS